jgi:hypothetical protein
VLIKAKQKTQPTRIYQMKIFPFLLVALLSSQPVAAQVSDERINRCEILSTLAKNLMTARQRGVSQVKLMKMTQDTGDLKETMQLFVSVAFKIPRRHSESAITREIEDFQETVVGFCFGY